MGNSSSAPSVNDVINSVPSTNDINNITTTLGNIANDPSKINSVDKIKNVVTTTAAPIINKINPIIKSNPILDKIVNDPTLNNIPSILDPNSNGLNSSLTEQSLNSFFTKDNLYNIGTQVSNLSPVQQAINAVISTGIPTKIIIPDAIKNIINNTPLQKYLPPDNTIDLLHPIPTIDNTLNSAKIDGDGTLKALKKFFDPSLLPADDYSQYILMLSEIVGVSLLSYLTYRIIIKKNVAR